MKRSLREYEILSLATMDSGAYSTGVLHPAPQVTSRGFSRKQGPIRVDSDRAQHRCRI